MPQIVRLLKLRGLKIVRNFLMILGVVFALMIILSFTHLPFWAYYSLATKGGSLHSAPNVIVLMGSAGMPSPEGFQKCYVAAEKGKLFPNATVMIALPGDSLSVKHGDLFRIQQELMLRGVDSLRIKMETIGSSTHEQAQNIYHQLADSSLKILIVSTPEHIYRSVKSFQKAGFSEVGGNPAFAKDLAPEYLLSDKKSQDGVKNLNLRYNVWNYFKYQITVLREYTAIFYYKIKGWI